MAEALDRPGNKLAYGLENPRVGLSFLIPGTPETLRINGTAELTSDPVLFGEMFAERAKEDAAAAKSIDEAIEADYRDNL